jgi:hypothetical protein
VNAAQRLLAAMHTAGSNRGRYVLAWHTLAQSNDALRAAFRAAFGKRMPTVQKLGQWLSEHIGAQGDYLLEGRHKTHKKAWAYRVVTLVEVAERERKRAEEEAALQAQHEEQQAAIREAQQRAEEARRAALSPVEYETTTRVAPDGRVIHERAIGRDGQPLKKHPEQPAATPEKPAEPERPKTRVEQMRADYLQHHQQHNVGARFGFANPGGIVGHNMLAESDDGYYCRVAGGRWPT